MIQPRGLGGRKEGANEISPGGTLFDAALALPSRIADRAGQEGVRCKIHRGESRRWFVPVVDQGMTWEEV